MPMFSLDFGVRKDSKKSFHSVESLSGSLKAEFGRPHYKSKVEAEGKLDFGELELELYDSRYMLRGVKGKECKGCTPSCIPITIILILIILVVALSIIDKHNNEAVAKQQAKEEREWINCRGSCSFEILESIPDGLYFNGSVGKATADGWRWLIENAKENIHIGSFYWNLVDKEIAEEFTTEGRDIYNRLLTAGKNGIKIKIAQNKPNKQYPDFDTANLVKEKAAEVVSLDFKKLSLSGILHTKLWLVDSKHLYIGSANMDWKSLTQVKELGLLIKDCPCIAKDLEKIFNVYFYLGSNKIPPKWPSSLATNYNLKNPMNINFNNESYKTIFSSSPPEFNPSGRVNDIDALLSVVNNATDFINIAVMDYEPLMVFGKKSFWPVIDDALRKAAIERGVKVKLLISKWPHTRNESYAYLNSLKALNSIVSMEIKLMTIPSFTPAQAEIPYARVNHNKYMITEKSVYISTSNWSGDYFTGTAGVSFVATGDGGLHLGILEIFERDWDSQWSEDL